MNPTDEPGVIVISPKVEWLVGAVETAVVWLVMFAAGWGLMMAAFYGALWVGDHLL